MRTIPSSGGVITADFDNDGDMDLYVANGHLSGNSALDYCTRFWCHDVYTGTSKPNETLDTFFSGTLQGLGSNYSWNGFEHNHLFLNRDNTGFSNAAFLLSSMHGRWCSPMWMSTEGRICSSSSMMPRHDSNGYS